MAATMDLALASPMRGGICRLTFEEVNCGRQFVTTLVICHRIHPPLAIGFRPKEGADNEANDTNRRADDIHPPYLKGPTSHSFARARQVYPRIP